MCLRASESGLFTILVQQVSHYKSSEAAEMGDHLITTDMGQKVGAAVPLLGGAGSPPNTMWPGPRPTSVPTYQVES